MTNKEDCKFFVFYLLKSRMNYFAYNFQGSEVVKGIIVDDYYFLKDKVHLSVGPKAFSKMTNLRLLKICNLQLRQGLECLSNKLRLLDWHQYPWKSLPSNLQLDKTVEFKMCYSCVEELWKGTTVRSLILSVIYIF